MVSMLSYSQLLVLLLNTYSACVKPAAVVSRLRAVLQTSLAYPHTARGSMSAQNTKR